MARSIAPRRPGDTACAEASRRSGGTTTVSGLTRSNRSVNARTSDAPPRATAATTSATVLVRSARWDGVARRRRLCSHHSKAAVSPRIWRMADKDTRRGVAPGRASRVSIVAMSVKVLWTHAVSGDAARQLTPPHGVELVIETDRARALEMKDWAHVLVDGGPPEELLDGAALQQ